MCILTELGLETGFPKGARGDVGGRYEWALRGQRMKKPIPEIIKEPQMCADIDLRIEKLKLKVDHVFIMLRRPGPLANALEFTRPRGTVSQEEEDFRDELICQSKGIHLDTLEAIEKFKSQKDRGITADDLEKIEGCLTRRVIQVVHLVAEMDIPHTLVSYPRYAAEPEYAYKKFEPLLKKHDIDYDTFLDVHKRCVDKAQVDYAYNNMPEWCRAMMREAYAWRKRI